MYGGLKHSWFLTRFHNRAQEQLVGVDFARKTNQCKVVDPPNISKGQVEKKEKTNNLCYVLQRLSCVRVAVF